MEKNQQKPAGETSYCGKCGNPDCICGKYAEREVKTDPGPAPVVKEG